jgi:hypothetical protein
VIALLGFLITLLLNEVELLVLPWRRDR